MKTFIPMDDENSVPCTATCLACGKEERSGLLFAHLEGEPYKAFYCRSCIPADAVVLTRKQFFAKEETP